MNDNMIKLIKLYDKIIYGDQITTGLLDCRDHYYANAFDSILEELENAKKEVKSDIGYFYPNIYSDNDK